jgi:hypothetical protein
MLNERLKASRPIAKSLKGAEESLNDTIRMIGTLLTDIASAKAAKGTRFAYDAGIAAGEKIALAGVSAMQSYRQILDAHAELAKDRNDAGLATVSFGDNSHPLFQAEPSLAPALVVVGQ